MKLKWLELPANQGAIESAKLGLCSTAAHEFVLEQVLAGVNHVVQRDGMAFETEVAVSELMVARPQTFIDFPISSILNPAKAGAEQELALTQLRVKCSSWAERHQATGQLVEKLRGRVNEGLLSDIQISTLELISNAVIHGPQEEFTDIQYDKEGHEHKNSMPIFIKPSFLTVGFDDDRIVVVCRDLYGELKVENLLQRVERCYQYGMAIMMNHGEGGAGVGSYMLFKLAAAVYIAVAPGAQTIIALTFPTRGGARVRQSIPKNLHIHTSVAGSK
jgi:hypothetical protein